MHRFAILVLCLFTLGCERLDRIGQAPGFNPVEATAQHHAMHSIPLPERAGDRRPTDTASIWSAGQKSLLGDRRASRRGDILTVVIEIDDRAEMSNNSARARTGSESMSVSSLFGLPQRVDRHLPDGASMGDAVATSGAGSFSGDGAIRRNERLTLRVATTIVEQLPNGVLRIEGTQEVRVNQELRELVVTGYVRPEDISRRNEITYDKIAGARIAYGGRGLISDVQRPRWGQDMADIVLPF
ncbi:flagellar basal body L-ring protein FlgH [Alkalilacustris brevis]|uniref:flagellar basal body L-ring protein FlgH n=1 Tax=Alkalilacustris brevis TaxID=2026338 RepID=UPI000E0DFA86|nr:flagellar basal body L-ring protein FlgH [Alkalilacustris brevis]